MISFLLSTPHRLFISRLSPEPLRLTHPFGVYVDVTSLPQGALRDPGLKECNAFGVKTSWASTRRGNP